MKTFTTAIKILGFRWIVINSWGHQFCSLVSLNYCRRRSTSRTSKNGKPIWENTMTFLCCLLIIGKLQPPLCSTSVGLLFHSGWLQTITFLPYRQSPPVPFRHLSTSWLKTVGVDCTFFLSLTFSLFNQLINQNDSVNIEFYTFLHFGDLWWK